MSVDLLYRSCGPRRSSMGVVYFIAPEAVFHRGERRLKVVKIGFTRNSPESRLAALQTGSPVPLEILAAIEAREDQERAIHHRFASLRSHGEWFFLRDELEDFVLALTAAAETV